jgi:cytoskeletal protein RodZ
MVVTAGKRSYFMNTNDADAIKARRLKTIIVMIVAAIVIVFVGIWAITSALGSGKKNETNGKNTETAKVSEKDKEKQQTGSTPSSPADQYTANTQAPEVPNNQPTTTEAPAPAPVTNDIPSTGPSEIIVSALALGVVAYLSVLNLQLVKKEQ